MPGDLVAIAAEYVELEAEYSRTVPLDDSPDEAIQKAASRRLEEIGARHRKLRSVAVDLPAWTAAQLTAKAQITHCDLTDDADFVNASPVSSDGNMAWSLCQDIMGLHQGHQHPDAGLLALCSEFLDLHAELEAKAEGPTAIKDDDEFEAYSVTALGRMLTVVHRLEAAPPRTEAGVVAVLRCLAAHNGEMHSSFDQADTMTHRLLRLTLRGANEVFGFSTRPHPDADLLALRPEYERLKVDYDAANRNDVPWDTVEYTGEAFDDFCIRIAAMPAAVTAEGRAFQAVAALHQLAYVADWSDGEEATSGGAVAWRTLAGIVGSAFPLPTVGRLP